MTTIAFVGPDGSGKSTVVRAVAAGLGRPTLQVYMGVNPNEREHQLPTTRLVWALRRRAGVEPETGPPAPAGDTSESTRRRPFPARALKSARRLVRVANLIFEELYRTAVIARAERRGVVVLLDRHYFLDYFAHDVAPGVSRDLSRRLHGLFLEKLLRKPDVVVYLEAPAEVLHARKGEGTVDDLRRRQRDYEAAFDHLPKVVRIDAAQPLDAVVAEAMALVNAEVGG